VPVGLESQVRKVSQREYSGTAYEDQSWEIVGELAEHNEFVPMEINIIPRKRQAIDPMFQDFGGLSGGDEKKRMHLPTEVAKAFGSKAKVEDKDLGKLKLLPEELEALKRQAFEEGVQAGMGRGEEEANTKLQVMQKGMQTVLQDLAQQITQNLRGIEKNAAELALGVAEKMVGYAVEINPEYIGQLVKEALTHAGSAAIKKVRVSPQDMEFIEIVGIPKQLVEMKGEWTFEKDDRIKAGCVVETSAGEIDFRLDEAWERVKGNVLKALG